MSESEAPPKLLITASPPGQPTLTPVESLDDLPRLEAEVNAIFAGQYPSMTLPSVIHAMVAAALPLGWGCGVGAGPRGPHDITIRISPPPAAPDRVHIKVTVSE